MWAAIGASFNYLYGATRGLPDAETVLTVSAMPRATTIVDRHGRHAFTIFQEQRLHVPLTRISPHLLRAVLAVEDQRFYAHEGVDVIRVAGAAVNNVLARRAEQGGSTITQQLARLTFLTPDKTFRRKLQEVVVAIKLEHAFTKDEILELYLNKAYFGDGLHGVEAAALGYFGKHASELTIPEAALLAGLVKSPSNFSPAVSPERAVARRNLVLEVMRDVGVIDRAGYDKARRTPLRLEDALRREEAYGQYFKEEVRKQLVERFGWDRVYQEGLKVETTLDLDMQKAADAEVARAIRDIEQRLGERRTKSSEADPLQAALVALDPRTGEVRAMVGGRAFDRSRFNRATQAKRQPGSAFKPFVYAVALEAGYTPATIISELSTPVATMQGAWLPDDEHLESSALTMRAALRTSSNRAAVQMLQAVGVDKTATYAEQLGLGKVPRVPSLALGSGEVTLMSLTSAFGAFANEGALAAPILIRRVTSRDGQVLFQVEPTATPAVSPSTAFLITSMLEDVVNAGTAAQSRSLGFRLPAAGKTGTTNEYRDAWFVGYTPSLVTGVWVGHDQPKTIVRGGYAAQLAVPLWSRFMAAATRTHEAEYFRRPSTVTSATICRLTGQLATDACRQDPLSPTRTEYFRRGTEPTEWCVHVTPGLLEASVGTPPATPVATTSTSPAVVVAPIETMASIDTPPPAVVVEEPEPPKKKRGFWGRLFGRGGDRDDAQEGSTPVEEQPFMAAPQR